MYSLLPKYNAYEVWSKPNFVSLTMYINKNINKYNEKLIFLEFS
jgi:hypothetical protein